MSPQGAQWDDWEFSGPPSQDPCPRGLCPLTRMSQPTRLAPWLMKTVTADTRQLPGGSTAGEILRVEGLNRGRRAGRGEIGKGCRGQITEGLRDKSEGVFLGQVQKISKIGG